jgi:hypothetical protein
MDIDEIFGNMVGDNLAEDENDEHDENECYNWMNHPIRQLFDNRKNKYHQSYYEPNPDSE